MAIHFGRQVYIFIGVAALQTANDSFSTANRTAPDAAGSPRKPGSPASDLNFLSLRSKPPTILSPPRTTPLLMQRARHASRAQTLTTRFFDHVDNREGDAAFERDFQPFQRDVPSLLEQLRAGQGGSHFKARESGCPGSSFAGIQKHGANAAPRPI